MYLGNLFGVPALDISSLPLLTPVPPPLLLDVVVVVDDDVPPADALADVVTFEDGDDLTVVEDVGG